MCHVLQYDVETTTINYSTNIILIRSDMTGQVEGIYATIEERLQMVQVFVSRAHQYYIICYISLSWLPIIQIVQIHAITIGVKNTKQ
jgi:hypothetical protein